VDVLQGDLVFTGSEKERFFSAQTDPFTGSEGARESRPAPLRM